MRSSRAFEGTHSLWNRTVFKGSLEGHLLTEEADWLHVLDLDTFTLCSLNLHF